jgi:hypothetical protein
MPRPSTRACALSTLLLATVVMWGAVIHSSQAQPRSGGGFVTELIKQKLEALKAAAAANRAALSQYSWTESIQVSVNGEVKSTKQMNCRRGADGKPQCTPTEATSEQQPARGLMGRIKAEKKEEFIDYIKQVKALIGNYVPLDPAKMQAAHDAGKVSLSRPGTGEAGLAFRDYALPGDSMTLDFSTETHKIAKLAVNSYLGEPTSTVTLAVQFANLPDGTTYPAQETVDAAGKGIKLDITNSNYQKIAP